MTMRKLMVAIATSLSLALGLWFALGAGGTTRTPSSPGSGARMSQSAVSQSSTQVASTTERTSASNGAAVADTAGSQKAGSESGNESASESETGGDDESDGYEDPNGQDVNHECPPRLRERGTALTSITRANGPSAPTGVPAPSIRTGL